MFSQVIVHEGTKTKYAMGYLNGTLFSEWVTGRVLGEGPSGKERPLGDRLNLKMRGLTTVTGKRSRKKCRTNHVICGWWN